MSGMPEFDKLMWKILRARLWRLVHNVVAHPLMEVLPERYGTILHDWTAQQMETDGRRIDPEDLTERVRALIERLSPEAWSLLDRCEGPITLDILRRASAITDRALN